MHLTDEGTVYQGEGWIRASLPLRTCGSIVFVLPDEDVSLADLYVDANVLAEALYGGTSTSAEISWSVPKIRIESTLELRDYLEEKIPTAFSMEADLSAMLKETSGYISDVRQKAYLEWDEEGVAAAAYTEVSVNESAARIDASILMQLNRPFLFAVMTEDLPVFIGCYT